MQKDNLRTKLEEVIDKYELEYKGEDLAPANVEYDLIDDIVDLVSDEVSGFILEENKMI
jgi:hypothetical protein